MSCNQEVDEAQTRRSPDGHPSQNLNFASAQNHPRYERDTYDKTGDIQIQRVPRRYKTLKRVELFHRNFVLDSPTPSKLLDMCTLRTQREVTHMRYTAATCDPVDFKEEGYTLRQTLYNPPRRTELCILVTICDENEEDFCRTLCGVMKNIAHLCTRERSKTWGREAWKSVVVCIVSDGRKRIHPKVLAVLATMGVYQGRTVKNAVNSKPVTGHIYEYTSQICVTPSLEIEGPTQRVVPAQIIFCLKAKSQMKVHSHQWFFNAFCPILQPNICVLLDAGVQPGPTSIYHLWKTFDIDSSIAGACGETKVSTGKYCQDLINPLVAAQNFDYKMSNILDHTVGSLFGYFTWIPGSLRGYRYIALQNSSSGEGPLRSYFERGSPLRTGSRIFATGTYLASDNVLCWELVAKRGSSWFLHYTKSAYSTVRVQGVDRLISCYQQQLITSFFMALHDISHFYQVYCSSHTLVRKVWLHIQMVYRLVVLVFSWFSLANYYIVFAILGNTLQDRGFGMTNEIRVVNKVLNCLFVGLVLASFVLSLSFQTRGTRVAYTLVLFGFTLIPIYMIVCVVLLALKSVDQVTRDSGRPFTLEDVYSNKVFFAVIVPLGATVGSYVTSSILSFEPWHLFTSLIQYVLFMPSFVNVFNVYAFTRVDGDMGGDGISTIGVDTMTTGKDTRHSDDFVLNNEDIDEAYDEATRFLLGHPGTATNGRAKYNDIEVYGYRTKLLLLIWVLCNGILIAVVLAVTPDASDSGAQKTLNGYILFIMYSVALHAFIRFVGCLLYLVGRVFNGE